MISIVISAYNTSSTIERTIKSVLSQSYENWEMIIINDCSFDNTLEIVKEYANKDKRIKVLSHHENKGAGLARRTGIENITGEYTIFLDSDDYLKEDCLEVLYNTAVNNNVDIVSPGYIVTDLFGNILETKIPEKKLYVGDNKFSPNKEETKRFMNPMLIKSSLWNNVTYSSRRFLEDIPTLVQLLYYANGVLTLDYAGYYYVQNPTSLIHSSSQIKHDIFRLLCIKDVTAFFNNKGENLSNNNFLKEYNSLLEKDIEEDEYIKYKNELDELYTYYLSVVTN